MDVMVGGRGLTGVEIGEVAAGHGTGDLGFADRCEVEVVPFAFEVGEEFGSCFGWAVDGSAPIQSHFCDATVEVFAFDSCGGGVGVIVDC